LFFALQAVPYDMSLASIKKYIWRRSDDPTFQYRVRGKCVAVSVSWEKGGGVHRGR
jgi:hypothetical protein